MPNQQVPGDRASKVEADDAPASTDGKPPHSRFDEVEEQAKEFVKSHFGNPESGEVYGVGNDYETEEEQVKDEKASGAQAIWFIGTALVLTAIGYWFLG